MLWVEKVIIENPRIVPPPVTTGDWCIEFTVKLTDPVGTCWLTLRGVRIGRGRLLPPRRNVANKHVVIDLAEWNEEFSGAVLQAATAAGWAERWPTVRWPKEVKP